MAQDEIRITGHAIEARIYAEDPARDFAPSVGRLALFRTPAPTDRVRIDTGFATGDTVSTHYDAMLAKLICHGSTRDEAILTLRRALADTDVVGVTTQFRPAPSHRRSSGVRCRRHRHRLHRAPCRHADGAAGRTACRGVGGRRTVRADR